MSIKERFFIIFYEEFESVNFFDRIVRKIDKNSEVSAEFPDWIRGFWSNLSPDLSSDRKTFK